MNAVNATEVDTTSTTEGCSSNPHKRSQCHSFATAVVTKKFMTANARGSI
jgi:hypothetical protein